MFDSLKITVITPTQRKIIEAPKGENLLRALGANQIFIPAPCGGRGICNKCKVRLLEGQVDVPITDGCFNACAYTIKNDITIAVDNTTQKAFHATVERGDFTIKKQKGYGVAIDIGTTSLAAYLADLESGKIIDSVGELNRQGSFGADVLSRISFSKDHLTLLTHTIHTQIDGIKEMFCKKHGISAIEKTVICGNNTMLHLLCGVSPLSMGESPFTPVFTDTQYRPNYITLPSASAYIGSDIIAGVLSCGMADNPNNSLLIDIGTNGEMVLKYKGGYYACATAAGPAFEGGNISMGIGGVHGAIDHVWQEADRISFSTVSGEAKGICGSGLVDLIALLVQVGIIDASGRMQKNAHLLSNNLTNDKFYLNDKVYLTQKDVREFQLAKSAVRSGIEVLLTKTGCKPEELDKIYLAGGLGYYINRHNAVQTGFLPKEFQTKLVNSGNTAGKGAVICLLNEDYIAVCESLAQKTKVIELDDACFYDAFITNMSFGKGEEALYEKVDKIST